MDSLRRVVGACYTEGKETSTANGYAEVFIYSKEYLFW